MIGKNISPGSILTRLERLEKIVFDNKRRRAPKKQKNFKGLKGGIELLITQNYFKIQRAATEVKKELGSQDYRYSIAAIQTTLNRMSKKTAPLVTFNENGKKYYANRK